MKHQIIRLLDWLRMRIAGDMDDCPSSQTQLEPLRIRKETLIVAMRRLSTNEDFSLLRNLWFERRWRILEDGKEKPSEQQWFVLKGFDAAILETEKWAAMQSREDEHQRRAAILQANLAGTSEER